jgi:hypothetical protein
MIEALVDELMGCGDADLDERVRALELKRRRIEAEMAVTIGEIGRRRSYLDDGHRSLKAYLRGTCNWSDAESARVARLTEAAGAVPGLVEALHAGRIGTPQTNELAVAHTNPRVSERLVEFAPMLLDHAERLSFFEFRACVKRFVTLADLDGAHDDLDVSIENRRAQVIDLDGSLCLDGSGGDPLINAELDATFRHFCGLEYDADIAARRDRFGNDAELHPLPRTGTQRGYDALVAIMRHAVANIEAGRTPMAAGFVVNILTDQHTFGQMLAAAGLAPDATSLTGDTIDPFTGLTSPNDLLTDLVNSNDIGSRRCETSTGTVLHPHTVLRAALAGHLRRVVLGADHVPINMGRKVRVFTGAAREAALLLAVRCDHLGCGLTADICQIDHSTEWNGNGRTDQDNAGVECGTHNRLKHRKRWHTKRDIHGRMHTIRTDGTIMLPVGARPPTFPDQPDPPAEPEQPEPEQSDRSGAASPVPHDIERHLDHWATSAATDDERACRRLRAVAIREVAVRGDPLDLTRLDRAIEPR